MAIYDTRYGLTQPEVNYLNQGLPSISGIFSDTPTPNISPFLEDTEAEPTNAVGLTPEQLALLYPQYNLGGGGGGGNEGPSGLTTNYGTYEKEYDPDSDYQEYFSGVKGTPSLTGYQRTSPTFLEGLMNIPGQLFNAYQQYSPINFAMQQLEARQQDKFERQRIANAARVEQQRQAEANAAGLKEAKSINAMSYAGNMDPGGGTGRAPGGDRGSAASGMGGGSRQATSAGATSSGRTDGGWGWAKGGIVNL